MAVGSLKQFWAILDQRGTMWPPLDAGGSMKIVLRPELLLSVQHEDHLWTDWQRTLSTVDCGLSTGDYSQQVDIQGEWTLCHTSNLGSRGQC